MLNLTTSQSPLVLSSNVYTSQLNSLPSSSTQPQLTFQTLISSLASVILPFLGTTLSVSRTGYSLKPATIKSEKPFYITKLNNRIKKCSGCGQLFRQPSTTAPDFVMGHLERDWYPAEGFKWKLGNRTKTNIITSKRAAFSRDALLIDFLKTLRDVQIGPSIPIPLKQVLLNDFKLQL